MIQRLRNIVLGLSIALVGGLAFAPAVAYADFKGDACAGVNQLNGGSGANCSGTANDSVNKIIKKVIEILSIIVGFIAVIMVIVGGLKMMTANGDSSAVASARSTIVYALIGLIVVAVAQILVHFVIFRTSKAL